MSVEAIQAIAKHSRAEDSARLVAVALAFYAQRDTHLAWPSDRELMAFTRLSRSTVAEALRKLQRAGEIHRQPRTEGGPRRTFLIAPRDGLQLCLDDECPAGRTLAADHERPDPGHERPAHAGAGSNRLNQRQNNTPPNPPVPGGDAPDLISGFQNITPPPPAVAVERAAGARRRHRRRRDEDGAGVASEPCPLQHVDRPADPFADEAWAALEHRWRERLGHQWEIWASDAHVHGIADGALVVALAPIHAGFVTQRWGPALHKLAEIPVAIVGCQDLAVSQ